MGAEGDPVELTAEEAEALRNAAELDSGTLVEILSHAAHGAAYQPDTTAEELRLLAALALELARRQDAAAELDD